MRRNVATLVCCLAAAAIACGCAAKAEQRDPDRLLAQESAGGPGRPEGQVDAAGPVGVSADGDAGDTVVRASGSLFAAQESVVMAEVPGKVLRLGADEGDLVTAGSMLAELDPTDYDFGIQQAQANLRAAQLQARVTREDRDRSRDLTQGGVLPEAALQGSEFKYDVSTNSVELAKLGVQVAERRRAQTVIRAPYDALVVNRMVATGTVITAMPPTVLFRLQDVHHLRLRVKVPELALRSVAVGDRVEAELKSLGLTIECGVTTIIASVDPLSRTFDVIADIDNARHDMRLRPGLFAEVRIRHGVPAPVEPVPAEPVAGEVEGGTDGGTSADAPADAEPQTSGDAAASR